MHNIFKDQQINFEDVHVIGRNMLVTIIKQKINKIKVNLLVFNIFYV